MTRVCSDEVEYIGWKSYGMLTQLVPVGSYLTWPNPLAVLAVMDPLCPLVKSLITACNPFAVSCRDPQVVTGAHEQVLLAVWRERGRGRVHRVRRGRGPAVLADECEVDILRAGLGSTGRVQDGSGDRVLSEAENVHRGAPLGRVTPACPHRDLPGRPGHPSRRIELQLQERGARVVGRYSRVDDVAVAVGRASRDLLRVGLRVTQRHPQPERPVQFELVGLARRARLRG